MIEKIETWFYRICTLISVAILLSITVFALMQVLGRYVFHHTFFWVEEITAIELGWLVAMGAPMMWLKNGHIVMDAIDQFLPEKGRRIWDCVIQCIAIAIGLVFAVAGYRALKLNSGYSISMLRYDESVRYVFVPVMGILLSLAACIRLVHCLSALKEGASCSSK